MVAEIKGDLMRGIKKTPAAGLTGNLMPKVEAATGKFVGNNFKAHNEGLEVQENDAYHPMLDRNTRQMLQYYSKNQKGQYSSPKHSGL